MCEVQEEPGPPLVQVLLPLCLVAQMKNTCDLISNDMCTSHKETHNLPCAMDG